MARCIGLPESLRLRLVELLVERGILVQAGPHGSRFIPGRPLDSVQVEEIFEVVEENYLVRAQEAGHPEYEPLRGLADSLVKARQRELGELSIADLLDGAAVQPLDR